LKRETAVWVSSLSCSSSFKSLLFIRHNNLSSIATTYVYTYLYALASI
jgi:hypothetical protein